MLLSVNCSSNVIERILYVATQPRKAYAVGGKEDSNRKVKEQSDLEPNEKINFERLP